jgi:ATP-binding cassette subfamily F protein uup
VIVVSHDRYFLDRTVDMIFAFESGGELRQYPGNYSVYLDYKKAEEEAETKLETTKAQAQPKGQIAPESQSSAVDNSTKARKLSFKEKREYETLEVEIPQLEAEKQELEQLLYTNPPSDFTQLQQLTERLAELNQTIDTATDRWLELAERAS